MSHIATSNGKLTAGSQYWPLGSNYLVLLQLSGATLTPYPLPVLSLKCYLLYGVVDVYISANSLTPGKSFDVHVFVIKFARVS